MWKQQHAQAFTLLLNFMLASGAGAEVDAASKKKLGSSNGAKKSSGS